MKTIPLIKKRDILIIAAILLLAIAGVFIPKYLNSKYNGSNAEIILNGELIRQVDLSNDTTFFVNEMEFEVKDHAIGVVHSPCHDQICVHTGFISKPSQVIVCVPQRLVVKIIGNDSNIDLTVG